MMDGWDESRIVFDAAYEIKVKNTESPKSGKKGSSLELKVKQK